MNGPQSKPKPVATPQVSGWSLEIVRGRLVGHRYALESGETIVGNALSGVRGVDLVDQEGSSPRKMAGRHAALAAAGPDFTIRDLESPGGTFVNQQRLLAGQVRRLAPGDVIQLGSVQLKVTHAGASSSAAPAAGTTKGTPPVSNAVAPAAKPSIAAGVQLPAAPGRLTTPFLMAGGAQCRTWDDFLVLAAQNWSALRDELTSGRLADHLRRIQRTDLVPLAGSSRSADDQLDDWLARVPATGSSAPELDVHPETLLVRAATGGGITRQTLRITNVGYRLLRCTARVEPPGTHWLRLSPEQDGRPFATIDQANLPVEIELPDVIDGPLVAQIVIESNGGSRRIGVRIERPVEQVAVPGFAGVTGWAPPIWREQLSRAVARVGPGARIAIGCAGAVALRLLAMSLNTVPIGKVPANSLDPRLSSVAIILVALGMIAGFLLASRRGEWWDFPAAIFAGGSLGLLAAAFWFAVLQSSERAVGLSSGSIWAVGLVSATLGALMGMISIFVFPYRSDEPGVAR